jgi:hypothetical protein
MPIKPRICSKMMSCRVVVGAKRDQMGMKPRQRVWGPSWVTILEKQSKAFL